MHVAGNGSTCFYKRGGRGGIRSIGHLVIIDRGMVTHMCVLKMMTIIFLISKKRSGSSYTHSIPPSAAGMSHCLLFTLPGLQCPALEYAVSRNTSVSHWSSNTSAWPQWPAATFPLLPCLLGLALAFELNCFRSEREVKRGEKTED